MSLGTELAVIFRRDLTRLLQEVEAFPCDEMLWKTLPGVTNSAGNLVLHLEGNLCEFIGRQLGGSDYKRRRPLEFSTSGLTQTDLAARVTRLRELIPEVLQKLSDAQMKARYPEDFLGVPLSSAQMLVHLDGHLGYHLGQIDYLRRILTAGGLTTGGLTTGGLTTGGLTTGGLTTGGAVAFAGL